MKIKFTFSASLAALLSSTSGFSQTSPPPPPSAFVKAPEAFARLTADQVRETAAYTLGVQAVLWGMQWVKAGESFRMFSRPLPDGTARAPFDSNPHGINVWGHAQKLLTAEFRTI